MGMNYKPRESRIYSFVKLIWGYLFLFKLEHKLFENGHIVLNKYSKIPEVILAHDLQHKMGI